MEELEQNIDIDLDFIDHWAEDLLFEDMVRVGDMDFGKYLDDEGVPDCDSLEMDFIDWWYELSDLQKLKLYNQWHERTA